MVQVINLINYEKYFKQCPYVILMYVLFYYKSNRFLYNAKTDKNSLKFTLISFFYKIDVGYFCVNRNIIIIEI